MTTTIDLAWAAGFLEGEGSFGVSGGSPYVTAAQVQKEPVERLARIFGGCPLRQRSTNGFSDKLIWIWSAGSHRSVQIMMTLYGLMSPKRQEEIGAAIKRWKRARLMKKPGSASCARGHPLNGHNLILVRGHFKRCRECINAGKRRRRLENAAHV